MPWTNSLKVRSVDARTSAKIENETSLAADANARRSMMVGYVLLVTTSVGWGLNWPITKHLLSELPVFALRGFTGMAGSIVLAAVAIAIGQGLKVPRAKWSQLVLFSILNITSWMALMGLALLYLPASEAVVVAATMPVWAAALAWPVLGERMSALRIVALAMALAGLTVLMGGNGFSISQAKLPGIALALTAAFAFALGTVIAKRKPLGLPPLTSAVWQIGIGSFPIFLASVIFDSPHFANLDKVDWALFTYSIVVQFCVAYLCWFAALQRLPASVAAIGTLLVPVVGVLASAATLGEPLGVRQVAALLFTVAGVVLASRS
jgi:drug/metabolite transporter (DMT)-like permease